MKKFLNLNMVIVVALIASFGCKSTKITEVDAFDTGKLPEQKLQPQATIIQFTPPLVDIRVGETKEVKVTVIPDSAAKDIYSNAVDTSVIAVDFIRDIEQRLKKLVLTGKSENEFDIGFHDYRKPDSTIALLRVKVRKAEVKASVAYVTFAVNPSNTQIDTAQVNGTGWQIFNIGNALAKPIPPGSYRLRFSATGYHPQLDSLAVADGDTVAKAVVLEVIPVEVQKTAYIRITSQPSGQQVLHNGTHFGTTPTTWLPIELPSVNDEQHTFSIPESATHFGTDTSLTLSHDDSIKWNPVSQEKVCSLPTVGLSATPSQLQKAGDDVTITFWASNADSIRVDPLGIFYQDVTSLTGSRTITITSPLKVIITAWNKCGVVSDSLTIRITEVEADPVAWVMMTSDKPISTIIDSSDGIKRNIGGTPTGWVKLEVGVHYFWLYAQDGYLGSQFTYNFADGGDSIQFNETIYRPKWESNPFNYGVTNRVGERRVEFALDNQEFKFGAYFDGLFKFSRQGLNQNKEGGNFWTMIDSVWYVAHIPDDQQLFPSDYEVWVRMFVQSLHRIPANAQCALTKDEGEGGLVNSLHMTGARMAADPNAFVGFIGKASRPIELAMRPATHKEIAKAGL